MHYKWSMDITEKNNAYRMTVSQRNKETNELIENFLAEVENPNDIGEAFDEIVREEEDRYINWKKPVELDLTLEELATLTAMIGGLNDEETQKAIQCFDDEEYYDCTPVDGFMLYDRIYNVYRDNLK